MRTGLSHNWLSEAAEQLEASFERGLGLNIFQARLISEAASLLGFADLMQRLDTLLETENVGSSLRGAITNVVLSKAGAAKPLSPAPVGQAEMQHPLFASSAAIEAMCLASDRHIALCVGRDYGAAMAAAGTELELQEVALTQIILGDAEVALAFLPKLSEQRRQHVLLVAMLEFYRHGQIDRAVGVRDALPADFFDPYVLAHMALTVSGRMPWLGYPYPDY